MTPDPRNDPAHPPYQDPFTGQWGPCVCEDCAHQPCPLCGHSKDAHAYTGRCLHPDCWRGRSA